MMAGIPIYYRGAGLLAPLIFMWVALVTAHFAHLVVAFGLASGVVFGVGRLLNRKFLKPGQPTHSFLFVDFEYCGLLCSGASAAVVFAVWALDRLGLDATNPISILAGVVAACVVLIVGLAGVIVAGNILTKLMPGPSANSPSPGDGTRRPVAAAELRRIRPNTYLVRGEFRMLGPFTKAELRREYQRGAITLEMECWREGESKWVPAKTILGGHRRQARAAQKPLPK